MAAHINQPARLFPLCPRPLLLPTASLSQPQEGTPTGGPLQQPFPLRGALLPLVPAVLTSLAPHLQSWLTGPHLNKPS